MITLSVFLSVYFCAFLQKNIKINNFAHLQTNTSCPDRSNCRSLYKTAENRSILTLELDNLQCKTEIHFVCKVDVQLEPQELILFICQR